MKTIIATTVVVLALLTSSVSTCAQTEQPFSVTKLCGITDAPDGFQMTQGFFTQLSPYYETPYEVYENREKTAVIISNMKDGCWVKIDSNRGPWKASPTIPVGLEVEFKNSRSRRLAASIFKDAVIACNNSADPDESVQKLYFYKRFQMSSTYDLYIDPCSDCETTCSGAMTFGAASIRLDLASHIIFADIVAGTAIVGEVW